jgi:hypothetical protein
MLGLARAGFSPQRRTGKSFFTKKAAMSSLPEFLLKITKATNPHKGAAGAMSIIIRQPYIWLEKELGRAFKGQEDSRSLWTGGVPSDARV